MARRKKKTRTLTGIQAVIAPVHEDIYETIKRSAGGKLTLRERRAASVFRSLWTGDSTNTYSIGLDQIRDSDGEELLAALRGRKVYGPHRRSPELDAVARGLRGKAARGQHPRRGKSSWRLKSMSELTPPASA
jgi:hypothetical protein